MVVEFRHRVSKPISRMARTGALCSTEICAAQAIEKAVFSILTQDIHATRLEARHFTTRASRANRTGGGSGAAFEDRFLDDHDLRRNYYDWIAVMGVHRIPAGPVLDVIIEGKALTEVDRAWRKRKGWTRGLLVQGLQLFIDILMRREEKNRLTA